MNKYLFAVLAVAMLVGFTHCEESDEASHNFFYGNSIARPFGGGVFGGGLYPRTTIVRRTFMRPLWHNEEDNKASHDESQDANHNLIWNGGSSLVHPIRPIHPINPIHRIHGIHPIRRVHPFGGPRIISRRTIFPPGLRRTVWHNEESQSEE